MPARARKFYVTKRSGEQELFSWNKLKKSLIKSGASTRIANSVLGSLEQEVYHGINTQKIYNIAFRLLRKVSTQAAARYKLKQAIFDLGPTGYPFEVLVSKLLENQGYKTTVGEILQGKCVTHEVDVLAKNEHHRLIIECKFHNKPGIKCDVKVPLYFNSRFNDLADSKWHLKATPKMNIHGWLITNTRFSEDAIQYGKCMGLRLVGWDYPTKGSLKERISLSGLFPITILNTLTKKDSSVLLNNNLIFCSQLIDHPKKLEQLISPEKVKKVIKEAIQVANVQP